MRWGRLLSLWAVSLASLQADLITLTFDELSDSTFVSTQYAGLTFSNSIVFTAGISLNEPELPPRSPDNVLSDFGGPISILFDAPITDFAAYFTYLLPLTLQAFDAADFLLGSRSSLFSTNLALSGDPGSSPNELIGLSSVGQISRIVIKASDSGGSFVLDDIAYTPVDSVVIPEPATLVLLAGPVAAFLVCRLKGGFRRNV